MAKSISARLERLEAKLEQSDKTINVLGFEPTEGEFRRILDKIDRQSRLDPLPRFAGAKYHEPQSK